jgi:Cellulase (glycosyl hydrolase family 5)
VTESFSGVFVKALLALLFAVTILLTPARASGQTLSVHGDRFAVDGHPRFLLFVSYFDGLHRPTTALIDEDLQYLKDKGVDGIRVFPDWHAPRLMDKSGAVNGDRLTALLTLVERAELKGMMVDLSFDPSLPGITELNHFTQGSDGAGGLRTIAKALLEAKRSNVLIDLCNEWDLHCAKWGVAGLKSVKDAIKAVDPARLVVVSARNEDQAVSFVKNSGFDAVTYHDPRDHSPSRNPDHNWATRSGTVVASLKRRLAESGGSASPVYLQEPSRFIRPGEHRSDTDDDAARYGIALANARMAGAAAWTFHTLAGSELSSGEPFSSLLLPGEQTVLDNLRRSEF